MKAFCAVLLAVVFTVPALCQPNPDTLWARTYGGNLGEAAFSIRQTADGGYVVAGLTTSFGAGFGDFYVVKTDGQGDTLWTRAYGGISLDYAFSVCQTTDGGYAVAGLTGSFGAGSWDCYVVKTDGQGDTLWTRTYGGSVDDRAYSIQQTTDGGYVVAGLSNSFGTGNADFYVVKTNGQGDTLWTRTYGGSGGEGAYSVQQTTDGGYVVAGTTHILGGSGDDFYVVKTDGQGDTLWTRTYWGGGDEQARAIEQTADGGYVVAGYVASLGGGFADFRVVKTDGQGGALWTRTYGETGDERAFSIQQTTDGGYVVAGYTTSLVGGIADFYVVKTNGQGDTLWTRTYGGSGIDIAHAIQQTPDGGYVLAGYTDSFGAGGDDFYVVKTGPDVLGTGPDRAGAVPSEFALFQNYPNPFNPRTTITFDLPREGHVLLNIFDLTGRSVATLVDEKMASGSHSINVNAANLPSGIYVYRLTSGAISQSRKLVLLK